MEELTLGGESRPVFVSLRVARKFAESKGLTLDQIDEAFNKINGFSDIPFLIFLMLEAGAKKAGKEWNHTKEDVQEWIEDLGFDEISALSDSIFSSVGKDMGKHQAVEPPPKKKSNKAKTATP